MPPAASVVLLVVLPISYSMVEVVLRLLELVTGAAAVLVVFVSVEVLAVMPAAAVELVVVESMTFVVFGLGADDLAVRVEFFLGGGDGVKIDFGGDADDGLAGAENLFEHILRLFGEVLFEVALRGELRRGEAGDGVVVVVRGKHVAQIVHDGDGIGA